MKLKFIISSNISFYKKTYKFVTESLINSGIPREDIYFFVGGSDSFIKVEDSDVNFFYVDYSSFEFTALISLIELNLKSDYWFLLHDTCYVGKNFFSNIKKFNYDTETIRLYSGTSMNIGAYSQNYLYSNKDKILSYKNKNYDFASLQSLKARIIQDEDLFFRNSTCKPYTTASIRHEGPIDFYNNGIMRLIEHFDELDFHKTKANWVIKPNYELNL